MNGNCVIFKRKTSFPRYLWKKQYDTIFGANSLIRFLTT